MESLGLQAVALSDGSTAYIQQAISGKLPSGTLAYLVRYLIFFIRKLHCESIAPGTLKDLCPVPIRCYGQKVTEKRIVLNKHISYVVSAYFHYLSCLTDRIKTPSYPICMK